MTLWRTHLALLLAAVSTAATSRILFHERIQHERHRIEKQAKFSRIQEMIRGWNSLPYTDVKAPTAIPAVIERIRQHRTNLTEVQHQRLLNDAEDIFRYLERPDFRRYYSLRTHGLANVSLRGGRSLTELLTRAGWNSERITATRTKEKLEAFWMVMSNDVWKGTVQELTSICVPSLRSCIGTNGSVEGLLTSRVRKPITAACENPDVGFRYDSSAQEMDRTYFYLSFYARTTSSTNAGPVYLSLVWSDESARWVPVRLMSDEALNWFVPF